MCKFHFLVRSHFLLFVYTNILQHLIPLNPTPLSIKSPPLILVDLILYSPSYFNLSDLFRIHVGGSGEGGIFQGTASLRIVLTPICSPGRQRLPTNPLGSSPPSCCCFFNNNPLLRFSGLKMHSYKPEQRQMNSQRVGWLSIVKCIARPGASLRNVSLESLTCR